MNHQELNDYINTKTDQIPIPDSISPENMKKMLDEQINENNISHNSLKQAGNTSFPTKKSIKKQYVAAACVLLCLAGSISTLFINQDLSVKNTQENLSVQDSAEDSAEDKTYDIEEAAQASGDTPSSIANGNEAPKSALTSPSDYEEYYNTLTKAYQDYYEQYTTVTNGINFNTQKSSYSNLSNNVTEDVVASNDAMYEEESVSSENESLAKDFSQTNNQETGIEEGDIVKTDGTYIYKLTGNTASVKEPANQCINIIKATDGNMQFYSKITLENVLTNDKQMSVREFFLYDNYLVVLANQFNPNSENTAWETGIYIYNIADKKQPTLYTTLSQSGSYQSSRISDGFLYVISNNPLADLDTVKPYSNYIPSVNGNLVDCSDIYYNNKVLLKSTFVITSLDLTKPLDYTDIAVLPTSGQDIYVSDCAIYLYQVLYKDTTKTEITKIHYINGSITPGASAIISGYLYDNFALSEYKGYLRIVATVPTDSGPNTKESLSSIDFYTFEDFITPDISGTKINVLYILDNNMQLTGKISGLAPDETIYSARFIGDIGYFVTYREVDPLFCVDLSDPEKPVVLSKLKIPGFSNYLHNYENGLLFGLGQEIEPETQNMLGLKLSMFDVTDPSNVKEKDKLIIEDGIQCMASENHHALLIDPEKNLIGFAYFSYRNPFYATYTYKESIGFVETAKYELQDEVTNSLRNVRGLYIGEYFYLVTDSYITSYVIGSTDRIDYVGY